MAAKATAGGGGGGGDGVRGSLIVVKSAGAGRFEGPEELASAWSTWASSFWVSMALVEAPAALAIEEEEACSSSSTLGTVFSGAEVFFRAVALPRDLGAALFIGAFFRGSAMVLLSFEGSVGPTGAFSIVPRSLRSEILDGTLATGFAKGSSLLGGRL